MKRKLSSLIAAVFIGIGAFSCICQAAGMDIDKEDGEYSIQVDLEGGSGKASVTSPTILTVKDGQAYAQIQWSSSNYDYMIVDGEKYLPTNEEGMNSVLRFRCSVWMKECRCRRYQQQWEHLMRLTIR